LLHQAAHVREEITQPMMRGYNTNQLIDNARHEPLPEAGAQRTLEAVGSSAWFG
jgi:hypothetical protein